MYASLWGDRWCGLHDSWIRVWWRQDEVLAVSSAYFMCAMAWPWVTNRSCDDVSGRSEQFLHCGRDGAGWEQQPTSLLPTWGMRAHVQTDTHFWCNVLLRTRRTILLERKGGGQTSQAISSGCWTADWIRSAGHWSNFPGGELDMPSNLRLIAMAPCYWRSFIQFFVL